VWRLDRLGRSLRHLIDVATDLADRGVGFRSLTESIDTTTPGGRLIFHMFGALAQFERELVRERTLAGLAAARARGRNGGRPTIMTAEKLAAARRMYEGRELAGEQIARALGVSRSTLYRALSKAGAVRPTPVMEPER
jgi:DNA invertase Pin-like site-specific DNA recombinase